MAGKERMEERMKNTHISVYLILILQKISLSQFARDSKISYRIDDYLKIIKITL